jgi:glycosyltransferase involved in cell wall biosynthesis
MTNLNNKTILQILPALNMGGVERGTIDIAQAIINAGGKAIVVSNGGRQVDALNKMGATHVQLPVHTKNPFNMFDNIARLQRLIEEYKVDIVHARSRAPAWSARSACKNTGAHFITSFHGLYGLGPPFAKFRHRYNSIMTKGEKVIAVSNFIADHIWRNYNVGDDVVRVIHRGVDLDKFNPATIAEANIGRLLTEWKLVEVDKPILFMPARFTRWKGQDIVLKALHALPHRNFFCIFSGDSDKHPEYYKELQKLAIALDLGENVRFVAATNHMPEAYGLCELVLCPSQKPEAFGRVAAEAGAMAKLVIATNHGGACETVIDGHTGWLIPPEDVQALTEAINNALNLSDERKAEMRYLAETNIINNFSMQVMQQKTLDVYREIISQPAH